MELEALLAREDLDAEVRAAIEAHLHVLSEFAPAARSLATRYQRLMSVPGSLLVVLDDDLTMIDVSVAAADLLAVAPEKLAGRSFVHYYVSETGSREQVLASVERDGMARATGRYIDTHGRSRVVSWCVSRTPPHTDGSGLVATGDDVTRSRRVETLLTTLVSSTSRVSGTSFLQALVCGLTGSLECGTALVATVDAQAPKAARAIAVAERGEPRPVFVYSLEGTPCQKVFDGAMCVHPARVQSLFPSDALLAEMGAEAYAGCPLTDTDGRTIGLLAVIDQAPFDNPEGVEFVVRLFAERAATELVRARTAEALGASERRFRRLFEGSADAQLLLDEREVMDCNRAALDLFGSRRRDRVVGRTMGQISPEQQPNGQSSERAGRGMIAEAMVNGSARFEWVYRRGDGSTFHAEVVLTAYVLDGRRLVLAVVRDVSLRKRIEDELRRSQERLDLAVRGGQLGLWDWSYPTGEFTVNEQAWRMLGYEPREFPSTLEDWAGLVHPDDRGLLSSAIAAQIEGTSALAEAEYRMRSKEGQWVWVQFRGQVVERDQAGEPLRIAGTRFDITARKRAEAEAQRYLRQLRATSDRILAAQEEERRRIASGLHDSVCQTLVGAGLELAALQMGVADEALRSSLGDLTRLVNHAADEVRSLTFEISPPLLYDVGLAAALEWFAARLEAQHDLTFELDTGPEELVLDVADRVFLFHGARELMLNVVEHARARVATVKLRSSEQQVRLTVSDDGIGFDPAMVGPDMASRDNFGLFNVRERLRSRGGRLLIESALGKGSRVVLMLPLTRDA